MVRSEDLVPFICRSLQLVDTWRSHEGHIQGKKKHDVHLRVSYTGAIQQSIYRLGKEEEGISMDGGGEGLSFSAYRSQENEWVRGGGERLHKILES